MTNCISKLPKDKAGNIILSPGGAIEGVEIDGYVDPKWFLDKHREIAESITPLDNTTFSKLKAIDKFWAENANKWRAQGII